MLPWEALKPPGNGIVWCRITNIKSSWASGLLGPDNMLSTHSATAEDSIQESIWDAASKQFTRAW